MISSAPARAVRVLVGTLEELNARELTLVKLAPDAEGRPREAVVLRDEAGQWRCYRNLCRHLPVPLDGGSRRFLVAGELQCGTHGARYRRSDGVCVAGPCKGTLLIALALQQDGERLYLLDAGQ